MCARARARVCVCVCVWVLHIYTVCPKSPRMELILSYLIKSN